MVLDPLNLVSPDVAAQLVNDAFISVNERQELPGPFRRPGGFCRPLSGRKIS
jgi:hypothetical protein